MAYEYGGKYYATLGSKQKAQYYSNLNESQKAVVDQIAKKQVLGSTGMSGPMTGFKIQETLGSVAKDLFGGGGQQQQQSSPAPAPSAPAGSNYKSQVAKLTAASEKYKKEAEALIAAGQEKIAMLEDEQLKAEKAQQLQAQLAIQSAVSQNLGQMAPTVKGAPTSKMQIGGTQKFKTAPKQFYLPQIQTASGLNIPTANTLNI